MKPIHNKLSKIFVLALILSLSHAGSITSATTLQETPTATPTPDVAQAAEASSTVVPNRYIITCASSGLSSTAKLQIASLQGTIVTNFDDAGIAVITSDHPDFAAQAAKISGITSVVNDRQRTLDPTWVKSVVSFDSISENPPFSDNQNPYFNLQWGLGAIHVPEAWDTGARGNGVLVAVLDTGIVSAHPDIQDNLDLSKSQSFVPGEGVEYSGGAGGFSHATHVAGIIAGVDNNVGIVGVAPEAKLMLVKVISDATNFGLDSWILAGIKYAVDQGADVINMSIGGYSPINDPIVKAYQQMFYYAYHKGATVIAAAGNENNDLDFVNALGFIELPGQGPQVLSVSAAAPIGWANYPLTTDFDNIASYSNYGSTIFLAAPGGDDKYAGPITDTATLAGITAPVTVFDLVFSSVNGGWAWAAGTSMAAPHVSGVAALIIGKAGGNLYPDLVRIKLRSTSDDLGYPGKDIFYGYGRVNAYRAVKSCST